MSTKRRVAVVTGGRSSEHEIALASARSVRQALEDGGHDVVTIEIASNGTWALGTGDPTGQIGPGSGPGPGTSPNETLPVPAGGDGVLSTLREVEVVLPILHGPFGEDGTVQGLLELADVPYVGAGVLASAVGMDKDVFKVLMRGAGVPVARSVTLRLGDAIENPFGYPVFVKPARLGSSVGITKVGSQPALGPAVELARRHDEKILVEELVSGVEVECGVLGNRMPPPIASVPGEIVAHGFSGTDWYDYSAKYDEGGMDLIIPPRISEDSARRVQEISVDAFVATECEGMARVDCFVRDDGEVLVNELNTIPGFTATSVYAKLFEASGIPYAELLERLIELALERHARRSRLVY